MRSENSRSNVVDGKNTEQVEDKVRNWVSQALTEIVEINAPIGKKVTSTKWMDFEYAKRKLGL